MQNSRRAPLLSATSSCEVIWIMTSRSLLELLHDAPTLGLRHASRLLDAHQIAFLHSEIVVTGELLLQGDVLAVRPMLHAAGHRHDHGLRHLRFDDDALTRLYDSPRFRRRLLRLCGHAWALLFFMFNTVNARASSRFASFIRATFSSCPV